MAQAGYTPISLYYSTTASAVPTAGNLVNGELAINTNDGKLYYKNSAGVVTLLASSSGASGDVVGPASATDTAVALFDGTTGKLIKNSLVTIGSTGNTVISGTDNTNAMLRITQLGTGNALLVEDSTNPDSTPFVIDASGRTIIGTTSAYNTVAITTAITPTLQNHGTTLSTSSVGTYSWGSNPYYTFNKAGAGGIGTYTAVSSGDVLGRIQFNGADGTGFVAGAVISAEVDNTPGTNDMPGRLLFSTTADGAATPTERMRIDSSGNVGIGNSNPTAKLQVTSPTVTNTIFDFSDDSGGFGPLIAIRRNSASPAANDGLGYIVFQGQDSVGSNTTYAGIYSRISSPTDGAEAGILAFYTTDTGTSAERFRIGSAGQLGIGGATYGTSGQVLTSNGSAAAPSWTTPSATTVNALTITTSGGAAAPATFNGSSAVTIDYSTVGADQAGTAVAMAIALG